jgi:hypothetical protein
MWRLRWIGLAEVWGRDAGALGYGWLRGELTKSLDSIAELWICGTVFLVELYLSLSPWYCCFLTSLPPSNTCLAFKGVLALMICTRFANTIGLLASVLQFVGMCDSQ